MITFKPGNINSPTSNVICCLRLSRKYWYNPPTIVSAKSCIIEKKLSSEPACKKIICEFATRKI